MKSVRFNNVLFKIDRPKGTYKKWKSGIEIVYPCDYGFFANFMGEDNEGLDAFIEYIPNGHYEMLQKNFEDGRFDESKFLVGMSTQTREKIYHFYKKSLGSRRVFRNMEDMMNFVKSKYRQVKIAKEDNDKKKGILSGYLKPTIESVLEDQHLLADVGSVGLGRAIGNIFKKDMAAKALSSEPSIKQAVYKEVLAKYKLSSMKSADIDKLLRGNVVAVSPTSSSENLNEDRLARTFKEQDNNPNFTNEETEGSLPTEAGDISS